MTLSLGHDRFFTLRAAALFLHNGHVLLQNGDDERVWFVPGGRVHAMEASADALRREMQEEIGDDVAVGPLQWANHADYRSAGRVSL